MKIRTDFVSNSSSSSFIVFVDEKYNSTLLERDIKSLRLSMEGSVLTLPTPPGKMFFDWDWENYYSLISKINFVSLQLSYLFSMTEKEAREQGYDRKALKNKFDKILNDLVGADVVIIDGSRGWIDHQSNVTEGENGECLTDMERFLFTASYIRGGNDNEDDPDVYPREEDDDEGSY